MLVLMLFHGMQPAQGPSFALASLDRTSRVTSQTGCEETSGFTFRVVVTWRSSSFELKRIFTRFSERLREFGHWRIPAKISNEALDESIEHELRLGTLAHHR